MKEHAYVCDRGRDREGCFVILQFFFMLNIVMHLLLLLLLPHCSAISLGLTILDETFVYVTIFLIQPLR